MTQTQSKTPAWIAYLATWLTGLMFLAVEKNDEDMRWHAAQSVTVFGAISIVMLLFNLIFSSWRFWAFTSVVNSLLGIGIFIIWIFLMYKAYKGERFRVPIAADFAEKHVINWFK